MIKVSFSEAYLYDVLSIYLIKSIARPNDQQASANHANLVDELIAAIGSDLHDIITDSSEYYALYMANLKVFQRIDEYKMRGERLGDATYIDMANYDRYLAKQALQVAFFPDSPLNEQKLGYGAVTQRNT